VAAFLEEKHKGRYLIFNLSSRKYDYRKFKNQVHEFKWEDHHSPAMNVLFEICQQMFEFLKGLTPSIFSHFIYRKY
jgi:phosphatidylinositol-3,4,5-trisphosphate 3-phosphatase/dual-specificity protein phosphatase PTEN